MSSRAPRFSRRSVLKGAAAVVAAPTIVPASVLGANGAKPTRDTWIHRDGTARNRLEPERLSQIR